MRSVLLYFLLLSLITEIQGQEQFSININSGERIESHLKKLDQLILAGKTPMEIHQVLRPESISTGTGSISGTVYESNGEKFQSVASVFIYNEFGYHIHSTSTDYNRNYKAERLPPGKYIVFASCFYQYKNQYYNKADNIQNAEWISVEDTNLTSIDFYLEKNTGSISGVVKNIKNEPVPKCYLNLIRDTGDSYTTSADSSGEYIFNNIAPGKYLISAKNLGKGNYISLWYNNVENREDAEPIEVFENQETQNINFILSPGGVISGKVIIPGYYGKYYPFRINAYKNGIFFTGTGVDSLGNFMISGLTKGTYKIAYGCTGTQNYLHGWYPDLSTEQNAATFSINLSDTVKNINITASEGGYISGKLLNSSTLPDHDDILLINEDNITVEGYGHFNDNYTGKYLLYRIPSGKYKLRIRQDNYIEQWYNKKDTQEAADWIIVNAPDTVKEINFSFNPGSTIQGIISDPSGNPVNEPCFVNCYNFSSRLYKSAYTENGLYEIKGLRSGDNYSLQVTYHGENYYPIEYYNNRFNSYASDTITISSPVENVNFTLNYKGTIGGYLNYASGQRITDRGYEINFCLFDSETGDYINQDHITQNGGYYSSAPVGKYKICYLSNNLTDDIAVTYFGGGNSFDDPASTIIELTNPVNLTIPDQTLETAAGSISGRILSTDSSALNELLFIYDENGYWSKIAYINNPSYKISGLRPGVYYIGGCFSFQQKWYGNAKINPDLPFGPKMKIPEGAAPIIVGEGETMGINFYPDDASNIEPFTKQSFSFSLEQNYPNPFNPETNITYQLPEQSRVTLKIYNMLGREMETLVDQEQTSGIYSVKWNASHFSSGIYFYTLRTDKYRHTKKLLLLK